MVVFKMMLTNPIILTIAGIEFCSGFLRQAIMQWYRTFAKQTDARAGPQVQLRLRELGPAAVRRRASSAAWSPAPSATTSSSRAAARWPDSSTGSCWSASIVLTFTYTTPIVGWLVVFMSMAVIGVHGMLSGTASMDFGGAKNAGIAVGIIDGFVYLGTGVMSPDLRAHPAQGAAGRRGQHHRRRPPTRPTGRPGPSP